jgi:hypothetical protein
LHEDYLNILQNTKDFVYFKKQEELYNLTNRHKKFRGSFLSKPFIKDFTRSSNINSLPIYTEDSIVNSLLMGTKNLNNFGNEMLVDLVDDSYESIKFMNYIHYLNFQNVLNIDNNLINPISYTQVLDNFRADYEEPQ